MRRPLVVPCSSSMRYICANKKGDYYRETLIKLSWGFKKKTPNIPCHWWAHTIEPRYSVCYSAGPRAHDPASSWAAWTDSPGAGWAKERTWVYYSLESIWLLAPPTANQ